MTHIRTLDGKCVSVQIFAEKLSLLAGAQKNLPVKFHSYNALQNAIGIP